MKQKLEYLLDPLANGFTLTRLSDYTSSHHKNKEIWVSAPCWFINGTTLPISWNLPGFNLTKFIQSMTSIGDNNEST